MGRKRTRDPNKGAAYLEAGPLYPPCKTNPGTNNDKAYHAIKPALRAYRDAGVLPVTVRQVYYKAVGLGLIPKGKTWYRNIANMLEGQRKDGTVHWILIRDATERAKADRGYSDPDAFKEQWTPPPPEEEYQRRLLDNQPYYMEVFCEAAGMIPYVASVAHKYGIDVIGSGGFDSLTSKMHCLARFRREAEYRRVVILQLGDLDTHGLNIHKSLADHLSAWFKAEMNLDGESMEAAMRQMLVERAFPDQPICSWDGGFSEPEIVRVALLPEHIRPRKEGGYGLTPDPEGKEFEHDLYQGKPYELESMEVADIQGLLEAAILKYWDEDAEAEMRAQIEEEQRKLKRWVNTVRRAAFPPKKMKAKPRR